jgi:acyl carrier protein
VSAATHRTGAPRRIGSDCAASSDIIALVMEDLVALLVDCGVMSLKERGIEGDVIAGRVDVPLAELGMDSLGIMEFCIALESRWGFSVAPEELERVGTLGQLAARLGDAHAG